MWMCAQAWRLALGQLGSAEALPALVAQLKDDRWNVRSSVA